MDAVNSKEKLNRNLKVALLATFFFLSGCQVTYLARSAAGHIKILSSQVSIEEALQDPKISHESKEKIKLAQEAKVFGEEVIGLKKSKNYLKFVQLPRPHVSYVVSAAERWQLKQFQFSYPIVGKMPYKGFFSEQEAAEAAQELEVKGYDSFHRGVSAYSTLGWLNDPILSSMLRYSDDDLVNTIIHESVHTTLYIKNNADFNERLAVFVGNQATEDFYKAKEGPESKTLQIILDKNHDDALFSHFIGEELKKLERWYQELPVKERTEERRKNRFNQIKESFYSEIFPKLKTKHHYGFNRSTLNNASLLVYKTYMQDLAKFQKLFEKCERSYSCFLTQVKSLEKSREPEKDLDLMLGRRL